MFAFTPRIERCLKAMTEEGCLFRFGPTKEGRYWLRACDPSVEGYTKYRHAVDLKEHARSEAIWAEIYKDEPEQQARRKQFYELVQVNGLHYYAHEMLALQGENSCRTAKELEPVLYWFLARSSNKRLRELALSEFGAPERTKDGGQAFQVFRGPYWGKDHIEQPPCRRKKTWYKSLDLLETGLVISIGGQRYEVRWPGVTANDVAPWDAPEREAALTFTPTDKPLTKPCKERGDFFLWGKGYYQQTPMYVEFEGQPAVQFLCVPDWHGHDFTANLALAIKDGKPVRAWFEGSCT